jgi:hypothetical protein
MLWSLFAGAGCSRCLRILFLMSKVVGAPTALVPIWSAHAALNACVFGLVAAARSWCRRDVWGGSNFFLVLESCWLGSSRVRLLRESSVWQEHAALIRTRSI